MWCGGGGGPPVVCKKAKARLTASPPPNENPTASRRVDERPKRPWRGSDRSESIGRCLLDARRWDGDVLGARRAGPAGARRLMSGGGTPRGGTGKERRPLGDKRVTQGCQRWKSTPQSPLFSLQSPGCQALQPSIHVVATRKNTLLSLPASSSDLRGDHPDTAE